MKVKCNKCKHCLQINRDFVHGKRIVCELNTSSMEVNKYMPGNYWGRERPVFCSRFEEK